MIEAFLQFNQKISNEEIYLCICACVNLLCVNITNITLGVHLHIYNCMRVQILHIFKNLHIVSKSTCERVQGTSLTVINIV